MRVPGRALIVFLFAALAGRMHAQAVQNLTLHDAENIALQNHPQIKSAENLAQAAKQQVREVRSAYYPQATGNVTGVDAEHDSRITAGALNNPQVFDRFADGVNVTQLMTDFGRTHELATSSRFRAEAVQENVVTSRANVVLQVDEAYFEVLRAQAVLQVAQETVKNRQLVVDQISVLAQNSLRSDLDVSFANVDLSQARLLLIQAQNEVQAAFADLSAALGYSDQRTFTLADGPASASPPPDVSQSVAQALQNRPELISEQFTVNSANSFATAERDLFFPTISAAGVAGLTPYRDPAVGSRYAAAGFNLSIPLFNGRLFNARFSEAKYRAAAEQQRLVDLRNQVVRDVRTAWLNANSGFERLSVTAQLLQQASQSVNLAQARYRLGLSSIVELSQAQLTVTQAQIAQATAKYDYETQLSVLNREIGTIP